ncbi:hypothetical protein BGX31_011446 [Mortierella sp. GBA43]|nr:hypothetical protein BGX31_011446 [Mortierella sp. GBA43]
MPQQHQQHHQQESVHSNPYRAPSHNNSCAFVPPKVSGYEFRGGSQAGNMGLMIGKRTSDCMPVTAKIHQSRVLLQHEHRILKRLEIVDVSYNPSETEAAIPSTSEPINIETPTSDSESTAEHGSPETSETKHRHTRSRSINSTGPKQDVGEAGLAEGDKYFNRVVEDFVDLEQAEMSILVMRRLGPNLLSTFHHRFMGLEETDGCQCSGPRISRSTGSPFLDAYTFLVFCLKAASLLEALQRNDLAHLGLSPMSFHWAPPGSDVVAPNPQDAATEQEWGPAHSRKSSTSLYHDADSTTSNVMQQQDQEQHCHNLCASSPLEICSPYPLDCDVNKTKLRLFDFTHSKILSHERARAPNNIFEWQVPGYLEYHLQYLAPEQTGRAETWMDHRTDIYGLGATLFSLLTMQFPNRGTDSVQILQGVLSRDLPPLSTFRPDMPPIIDDILRKMTQKQPSRRYQTAFGFKQDILRCLNGLREDGTIKTFLLGKYDVSFQFVLPNAVFGRQAEQQMISAAISQAASAYQNSINSDTLDSISEDGDTEIDPIDDSDHYVFKDDIVSLQSNDYTKIPLSSKTLLMTPKPFDGGKSVHRGAETTDPVVRAIFVSGPIGVGNVLQQLLAQHNEALASLTVAIRTAFEPNSGIGIMCDLIPELKHFFDESERPESKNVPLTHSVARFHSLVLKLIGVISTHFFMTWLIDDIHYADENSITLLSTLVNINRRLPIMLIMTHRDTVECFVKVKQILGGNNTTGSRTGNHNVSGGMHHDAADESSGHHHGSSHVPMAKAAAIRATGQPPMVRGGGGIRFIRLQNPQLEAIQEFLGVLLHRKKDDVLPLATVLRRKSWLTIRQLVLELYKDKSIKFNSSTRLWEWESCPETLATTVRKLTGEEYGFLESRFRALDCNTKKALVCAAICGTVFSIHDLQRLASTAYVWGHSQSQSPEDQKQDSAPETSVPDSNKGTSAMAGLQSALREGILVYSSVPDQLRWHHNIMRKVAFGLLDGTDEKERIHYEMAKILCKTPGQELKAASHILHCLSLVKKKLRRDEDQTEPRPYWIPVLGENDVDLDAQSLRNILSLAGEKLQKSGAQDKAMEYWNATLSLLPENCWDPPVALNSTADGTKEPDTIDSGDVNMGSEAGGGITEKTALYREALKLHLQCIEAERWREDFDRAMKICDTALASIKDPIDRARVYQHQIEMSVWAYSQPPKATEIAIQCLQELGVPKEISFNPSQAEIKELYDKTHTMLLEHMDELNADNPKECKDPRINMIMEVLQTANANLYYCNVPFLAVGVAESVKLVCKNGVMKDAGRALVSFALTHSTWHGCLENAYELGKLSCKLCKNGHRVRFLFHLTVQQWGDHVANSIPEIDETLQAADLTCDRLFHTADLIAKHTEFGPKAHGVEALHGILQLIKCLRGQTHSGNPETIFDDNEFAESKVRGKKDKHLVMAHNNSTYSMLKIVAAFVFGHHGFINEVTHTWHDDPQSMMNFEGSWISHSIFTVVGLTLATLLRTEKDPEEREKMQGRLLMIRDRMESAASKFPTNHASMFYLLEAEIEDQGLGCGAKDLKSVLQLYEKAIAYATEGDFPLHKCFAYEMAANCHLRHGLATSAGCLMVNACKTYETWGARGKVLWFYKSYPEWFGTSPDMETTAPVRGLFYRPSDVDNRVTAWPPRGSSTSGGSNNGGSHAGATPSSNASPWLSASPKVMYSPSGYGGDAVSAAAAAMAESCMATTLQANSTSSAGPSTGSHLHLQSGWAASPQSPEMDNADLDVLDFSSVIEAMQVIASEIDLNPLLVKSLGVLNQSVGAKRCCVIISKERELFLAASQRDPSRCESVNPPMAVSDCNWLFQGVINYVKNTSTPCLLTNAKDDPRFCADDYLKQNTDLKTVLCAPIMHKAVMVGVLYMDDFPERAFANKRMLVMNLLVQQLGISITNALLYQSVLQSESKLNGLLENMPCGIALWDAAAENCQYINSSWEDMTGFTRAEITEARWRNLTHEDEIEIYVQHWRERVKAGNPSQWESRYRLKDGSFRWAIVRMLPIKSATENRIIQWLTVTIDIDDQRRAVQLKSNFLANMSHELRTPFSGILGMLSLLRDSSGLSHEQFEFVDMAKASCEMLIRIVDDLLNFSKLEADKVTLEYIPLCFEEIVGDVCDLLVPLASRKGLELIILFDDTLPLLLIGDPDRIKQILMNLIGNAIKFSSTGNVVIDFWHERTKREDIIRSKNEQSSNDVLEILSGRKAPKRKDDIEMDHSKLGDEIVLHCSVKDQGIGMTPEEQKMLFVSFQQTDNGTTRKYGGTGLGLSICSQLITHMEGKVTVDSEKGKGATFTFTAKMRTETEHDIAISPGESARIMECNKILGARLDVIAGKRVLVLSPNRQLRQQVVRILSPCTCYEYDDVESAVDAGAILLTGVSTGEQHESMEVDREARNEAEEHRNIEDHSKSAMTSDGYMTPFDFILVDHVLDSAELDRIYPSPVVAFVLLLAPTTETLRWILPPAANRVRREPEEEDCAEIDVGGRGRFLQAADSDYLPEIKAGQIQRVSHETSAQENNAALASLSESVMAIKPITSGTTIKIPSQLFKKRKSRGQITVTRLVPPLPGTRDQGKPRMETATFQVCRLIKPVRRMKILQIFYNALSKHCKLQLATQDSGASSSISHNCGLQEQEGRTSGFEFEMPNRRKRCTLPDGVLSPLTSPCSSVPMSPTSTCSHPMSPLSATSTSSGPLKRRREQATTDVMVGEELKRCPKSSRNNCGASGSHASFTLLDPFAEKDPPRNLGLSGAVIGDPESNLPKRARNNDALTLLLTPEERKRCRGKNVLVAEDDFVSQKILEKQLSKLGMNVMIANNGQEAVNQWLTAKPGHYTIAIFDHHMPIMDGLAATRQLRALEAEMDQEQQDNGTRVRIPIVGLSADIQQSTKESCIKAGMDEYMTKPLLTKGLAVLIQRYCCN